MAAYTIFKFKNMTPLHIGTGKENYDFSASELQSDTLSSALAALRAEQGKTNDLKEFLDSFVISSAFPFIGERYYLPKPQGKNNISVEDLEEHVYRKKLKKIKFVESSIWAELQNGKHITIQKNQLHDEFLQCADAPSFSTPFSSQVNQRVTIPRDDSDAEPFFFDWKYFNQNAGLFCIVDATSERIDELEDLLCQLGETGLGTDKNIGGGKFTVERKELQLKNAESPNASVILSLFIPSKEELQILNLSDSKYELVLRGGFLAGSTETEFRHLRKKSIHMFNVGSIFNTTSSLKGTIVNLEPNWNDARMHPVYRSGKPFVLPIKLEDYE